MPNGNVYVFNATPNSALLLLNDHILSPSLAGVQQSSSYAPSSVSAPRNPAAGNPGVAQFGGVNSLIVSFPSGSSQHYPVNIDSSNPDYSLQNDLELYVFYNEVVLVSPFGSASLPGTSLSNTQAQAIVADVKE